MNVTNEKIGVLSIDCELLHCNIYNSQCLTWATLVMYCNVAIERTNIRVLFTLLFAVGSDISILKALMAAAISPFMSPL